MIPPVGTIGGWENLRHHTLDTATCCSTVGSADIKTPTEGFGTGIVGSQAASSASQADTEPLDRPGTQALSAPGSALSIPKSTAPQLFSIATSETIPTMDQNRTSNDEGFMTTSRQLVQVEASVIEFN